MPILRNIKELVTGNPELPQGELIRIPKAAVAWRDGTIAWVGLESEMPSEFASEKVHDAHGGIAAPGLIDCHTHLAFAGWRADEFKQRILGKSYQEIARGGGGILSTVSKTRAATIEQLTQRCASFLDEMKDLGVTTVEAKSGYGLSVGDELKILEVYKTLNAQGPLTIVPTLLAAHTIPLEYKEKRKEYIALIVEELLPVVAKRRLALFCDVFIDRTAFSVEEAREILTAAAKLGIKPKLHADQLEEGGGAVLAGELRACSADHLEHASPASFQALARNNVVAVLLPLASVYTAQIPFSARQLLQANVRVAIATDFNPGTAPSYHLPLAMMLGCTMNRLTPAEALSAATTVAARALGIENDTGSIEAGKKADLMVVEADSIEHWLYHFRPNACILTFKHGVRIH